MTFIYNHSAKELVEKKPDRPKFPIDCDNVYEWEVYNNKVDSLTRYPYEGTPEMDGKEFEVRYEVKTIETTTWYEVGDGELWNNWPSGNRRVVAIPIEKEGEERRFTVEDLDACWAADKDYLIEILNGDYDLNTAREDLKSLIGSKYDLRTSKTTQP